MKTRNGFVSNSSSSSFIIKADDIFSTVKDVAEYIMSVCKTYYEEEYGEFNDLYHNEVETLKNISDPDTPMFFDTGSEETYIRKYDGKIIIRTNQNFYFSEISKVALKINDLSDDFYNYFDHINDYGEDVHYDEPSEFQYYFHKFNDFLILKYPPLKGHLCYIEYCTHCKKSYPQGWKLMNGDEFCNCQLETKLNYIRNIAARKDKLKKINENSNNKQ